jgi:hypothetical protein
MLSVYGVAAVSSAIHEAILNQDLSEPIVIVGLLLIAASLLAKGLIQEIDWALDFEWVLGEPLPSTVEILEIPMTPRVVHKTFALPVLHKHGMTTPPPLLARGFMSALQMALPEVVREPVPVMVMAHKERGATTVQHTRMTLQMPEPTGNFLQTFMGRKNRTTICWSDGSVSRLPSHVINNPALSN